MNRQLRPNLAELTEAVRERSGLAGKRDIARISASAPALPEGWLPNGDDAAAIPLGPTGGEGYQLLAMEGMLGGLVERDPWFAGWCGVMVNCSDIAAMGGTPTAIVNALWADGESSKAEEVMRGMRDASAHLGVPVVGGHTNLRADSANLAVGILGYARILLSSFAAKPGQTLVAAIDLRGGFEGDSVNWNAATEAPGERLRGDLALLPKIAEQGLAIACKDISQAGLLGTLTMLAESGHCGARVALDAIPRPPQVDPVRWLCAFPSFGYLLTTQASELPKLLEAFHEREIAAAAIGEMTANRQVVLTDGDEDCLFYDLNSGALTGFS